MNDTNSPSVCTVGVDIGGTNTVLALVDKYGNITTKRSFPTKPETGFHTYVKKLANELAMLIDTRHSPVTGIGIGAPCGNSVTGEIESPVHFGWGKINLANELKKILVSEHNGKNPALYETLSIKVANDANAAALGEHEYGAARDFSDFIELTLGTGVGSGIFVNGQLVTGPNGMAGELGHLRFAACANRKCGCGRTGCLDAWCSARGIVRTATELLKSGRESMLRSLNWGFSAHDICIAALENDPLAKEVFEITGKILGSAIADMVTFSAPQAVILFGGLAQSGTLILEPTRKSFARNVLGMYAETQIKLSSIPESDAAILGASALVSGHK